MRRVVPLLLVAALAAGACSKDEAEREDGDITGAGPISVFDLRPGDCLNPADDVVGEVEKIEAVPCAEEHVQEVFAVPEYPDEGGVYPGEAKIQQFADASCLDAFVEYTGTEYLDSNLYFSYLHPSVDSWNEDDDRQIVCVLMSPGEGTLTGSARATTTTTVESDETDETNETGETGETDETNETGE